MVHALSLCLKLILQHYAAFYALTYLNYFVPPEILEYYDTYILRTS